MGPPGSFFSLFFTCVYVCILYNLFFFFFFCIFHFVCKLEYLEDLEDEEIWVLRETRVLRGFCMHLQRNRLYVLRRKKKMTTWEKNFTELLCRDTHQIINEWNNWPKILMIICYVNVPWSRKIMYVY